MESFNQWAKKHDICGPKTHALSYTHSQALPDKWKEWKRCNRLNIDSNIFYVQKEKLNQKTCSYWLLKVINQILGNQWKCVYDCGFQDPLIVIILGRSHRFSFSSHSMHNIISMNCNFISWSKIWCSNYAEHTTLDQHNAQAWVHFVMVVLYAKFHAVWLCYFTKFFFSEH